MTLKTSLTAAVAALSLATGVSLPALAQEAAPAAPAATEPAGAYSQETLEAFVAAAIEVDGIQQEAAAAIQSTDDQAAQAALVEEANAEMVSAIEDTPGITVPEYVEIAEAAQTDAGLRTTLEQMLLASRTE
jgi:hypothetical protein